MQRHTKKPLLSSECDRWACRPSFVVVSTRLAWAGPTRRVRRLGIQIPAGHPRRRVARLRRAVGPRWLRGRRLPCGASRVMTRIMGLVGRTNQLDAATGFRSEQSGLAISAAAGARATAIGKQAGDCRSWRKNSATSAETSGDHRPLETTKSTPSSSRTIPMICSEVFENQLGRLSQAKRSATRHSNPGKTSSPEILASSQSSRPSVGSRKTVTVRASGSISHTMRTPQSKYSRSFC